MLKPAAAKACLSHDNYLLIFTDGGNHLIEKVVLNGSVVLVLRGNDLLIIGIAIPSHSKFARKTLSSDDG